MAYDSKAIKLPKQIKRSAALILDPHVRGAFIRSFVKVIESEGRGKNSGNNKNKSNKA
jgi:hypothetical protein